LEIASRNLKPAVSKETPSVTSTGNTVMSTVCTNVAKSTSSVSMDASKQSFPHTATTKSRSGQDQTDYKSVITSDSSQTGQNGSQKVKHSQSVAVSKPCVQRQARVKMEVSTAPSSGSSKDSVALKSSGTREGGNKTDVSKSDVDVKQTASFLRIQKNAARASFFSSLTTPPTSPQEEKKCLVTPTTSMMDYTVRISPVKSTSSGVTQYTVTNSVTTTTSHKVSSSNSSSNTKPTSLPVASSKKPLITGESKSVTPSPTSPNFGVMQGVKVSNIPRVSAQRVSPGSSVNVQKPVVSSGAVNSSSSGRADSSTSPSSSQLSPEKVLDRKNSLEISNVKTKKVPPPPPPRKSSRLPNQMPTPTNGSVISPVKIESSTVQDSSVVTGHMIGASLVAGTLTSTPKTSAPVKPTTKFEKDLVVGSSKVRNSESKRTEAVQQGANVDFERKSTANAQVPEIDRKHHALFFINNF